RLARPRMSGRRRNQPSASNGSCGGSSPSATRPEKTCCFRSGSGWNWPDQAFEAEGSVVGGAAHRLQRLGGGVDGGARDDGLAAQDLAGELGRRREVEVV